MSKWPKEQIPDEAILYHRINKDRFKHLPPNVPKDALLGPMFRIDEIGDGNGDMSADWCKYSNAEKLKCRARIPKENAVVEFIVGDVRKGGHIVEHAPDCLLCNRAHVSVQGVKEKMKITLSRIGKWSIYLESSVLEQLEQCKQKKERD